MTVLDVQPELNEAVMLTNDSFIKGLTIHAIDGELGKVKEFLFDDHTWVIRYFSIETGGWLGGRELLISPFSIIRADWQAKLLNVSLTKSQVENSPDISSHLPVSRKNEANLLGYYGYPYYWGGPYLWGPAFYPAGLTPVAEGVGVSSVAGQSSDESPDSHLRSSHEVTGYSINVTDGDLGHVDGFVIDDKTWSIRYIEVATRNWLPGKKVLIAPEWIDQVSWEDAAVSTALTREKIQNAPEYLLARPITREYEDALHSYYGRAPYWHNEA